MNPKEAFRQAAQIAIGNDYRNVWIGALAIRKDGTIVKSKNGPARLNQNKIIGDAHAEARLLRKAGTGSEIYVVRVRRGDGSYGLAKPCGRCMARLRAHKTTKVYYTISNEEWGCIEL